MTSWPMILVVKGTVPEVLNAIWERGFTASTVDETSDAGVLRIELVEPFDMETVKAWHAEAKKTECKPGVGYPSGTLLAYSGSNVI